MKRFEYNLLVLKHVENTSKGLAYSSEAFIPKSNCRSHFWAFTAYNRVVIVIYDFLLNRIFTVSDRDLLL
jgi:hypothetical protein